MLKVHNLNPTSYYKKPEFKSTLIADYSKLLGVDFSFDEGSNLCEVELPKEDNVLNDSSILKQIDWSYLQKNTSKKLIITHRTIYQVENYYKTLNQLIIDYDLKNRVYWLTFNPLDFKNKHLFKFNLIFLDPITAVFCEAYIGHLRDVNLKGIISNDFIYETDADQKDFYNCDKYFISASRKLKAHRLLSTYLITKEIPTDKGIVTFHGLDDHNYDQIKYLASETKNLKKLGIPIEELYEFQSFKGQTFDDVSRTFFAGYRNTFIDKLEKCLISYVQESTCNNIEIYVTEKTWQNYLLGRPFILNGTKDTLKFLNKYYGFKSFSQVFDESYDTIDNLVDRVYYSYEQLYKFCDQPFERAKEQILQLKDTLDYNRKIFLSINHKERFLKIFNEF